MVRFLRQLLAVIVGFAAGSAVNMGLVILGGRVVAPPAGADLSTMEGLKAALPLFGPEHFLFPFLAHALGALAGATVAGLLAVGRSTVPAWAVGGLFLCGGVANLFLLGGPAWFNAADLLLAYLPMAWLGQRIADRLRGGATVA